MQRNISDNVQLGQSLNPLKDSLEVEPVGYSADFNNMLNKLDKLMVNLWMLIWWDVYQV